AQLEHSVSRIAQQARARFDSAGTPCTDVTMRQVLDLRYKGQASELPVDMTGSLDAVGIAELEQAFHDSHFNSYGYRLTSAVEVVRVRTTITGSAGGQIDTQPAVHSAPAGRRAARFAGFDGEVVAYSRGEL